jgi:outer membrane lipoprotein-sorting protein
MLPFSVLLFLVAAFVAPAQAEETPEAVEACVLRNLPDTTSVQAIELRSRDRSGYEQVLLADVYWKRFGDGRSRVMMYFSEPADIRGARFLIIENKPENDMYIYMPGLFKVRRVTSRRISTSILGTDFSYEDFERLQGVLTDHNAEKQSDVLVGTRPAHVLATAPAEDSGYEKIVSYVDKETCVVLRTELYEPGGHLRKLMTVNSGNIEREGGINIPRKLLMQDLRDKTETRLVVQDIKLGVPIADSVFDPAEFKNVGKDGVGADGTVQ